MTNARQGFAERLVRAVRRRLIPVMERIAVSRNSQVIAGPAQVALADDECAVISLMKDAEYFCDTFINHHLALGARHIVIIDNGSTDRTVEIARGYDRVTVVQNRLPAKLYECQLRSQIARRTVSGGWLLFVDSDELFHFPFAGDAPVGRLLGYCNAQGYTAVVTQMLDLFTDAPYAETRKLSYPQAIEAFTSYSLGAIDSFDYHDDHDIGFSYFLKDNRVSSADVRILRGGLRKEVFGEDCVLTKHSLVRNLPGIAPMTHPHCASQVAVADVTALLAHYKFSGDYLDRDRKSVATATWDHAEDRRRVERIGEDEDFAITCAKPRAFSGASALVDEGFLVASERYRAAMGDAG